MTNLRNTGTSNHSGPDSYYSLNQPPKLDNYPWLVRDAAMGVLAHTRNQTAGNVYAVVMLGSAYGVGHGGV
jgi:hypothetical protein